MVNGNLANGKRGERRQQKEKVNVGISQRNSPKKLLYKMSKVKINILYVTGFVDVCKIIDRENIERKKYKIVLQLIFLI